MMFECKESFAIFYTSEGVAIQSLVKSEKESLENSTKIEDI